MDSKTKYSLYTYLFLFLSITIVFVFTKDFYFQIIENKSQIDILNQVIDKKNQEYSELSKIKSQIDSWSFKDFNFNKFLSRYREDDIVDFFYTYANNHVSWVKIQSISLSDWKLNEIWLKEAKIWLSLTFSTQQDMIDMINFLLKNDKYVIYIHEFSYPFWSNNDWPISISLPLRVLYK